MAKAKVKSASYHRAAVQYNQEAMDFFAEQAERLDDPQVARWAAGISRQHKFHMERHQKSLAKAERKGNKPTPKSESYYDEARALVDEAAALASSDIPTDATPDRQDDTSIAEQQRLFAESLNSEYDNTITEETKEEARV